MSTTTTTASTVPDYPQTLGHPRPLWMLFMTEFWERFAFYGIRWALTLYIVAAFFNGDAEYFKTQLAQWVKDFGIKTDDLKNLTIAALLGKMIASSKDSSLQSVLKSAHAMAKESGLADVMASTVLLNQSAKV